MWQLTTAFSAQLACLPRIAGRTARRPGNMAGSLFRFGLTKAARSTMFALLWSCATSLLPPQISGELKLQSLASVATVVVTAFDGPSSSFGDVGLGAIRHWRLRRSW